MGFNEWFDENLGESARDIAQYGADSGFPYITYTADCVDLYNQFEGEIWEMLTQDAEDCGHANAIEMVSTFGRLDMLETPDTFKNLLLWYACERRAREVSDA